MQEEQICPNGAIVIDGIRLLEIPVEIDRPLGVGSRGDATFGL
jgi:hypothetical protein